ncbi:hypothetical protein [Nitrosomonas sp.]|uniref:hypothetical protein n=1 Tax=Nitrosomonas sp. TaxID=42353 RepID=UPI0025D9DA91|nr:hypothetical protein [Nitrosomonas sp.]
MSEKTKVVLYTILLLAIFISWSIYSNKEKESCESLGKVYARQNMGWSFECKPKPTIEIPGEELPVEPEF